MCVASYFDILIEFSSNDFVWIRYVVSLHNNHFLRPCLHFRRLIISFIFFAIRITVHSQRDILKMCKSVGENDIKTNSIETVQLYNIALHCVLVQTKRTSTEKTRQRHIDCVVPLLLRHTTILDLYKSNCISLQKKYINDVKNQLNAQ